MNKDSSKDRQAHALEALRTTAKALDAAGLPDAPKEAELLLTHATGTDRTALYRDDPVLTPTQSASLQETLARRAGREPLQYILGQVEFYGLTIKVGPGVLVPRPETEQLVEVALGHLKDKPSPHVLDMCTGSGCVAVALASRLPHANITATDASEEALKWAGTNVRGGGYKNITLLRGEMFGPVGGLRFDAILCNPPYVPGEQIKTLQPEVRDWEPRGALDGGGDGMEFYRKFYPLAAQNHLAPGGLVAVEVGQGQADAVAGMAKQAGLANIVIKKDFCGIKRIVAAWPP